MSIKKINKETFLSIFSKPKIITIGNAEKLKSILSIDFALNGIPTPVEAHLEARYHGKKSNIKLEENDITKTEDFLKMFYISYTKKEQTKIINAGFCLTTYMGIKGEDVYTLMLVLKENYEKILKSKDLTNMDFSLLDYVDAINKNYSYKKAPKEILLLAHTPYPDFKILTTNVRNIFTAKAEKMTIGWGKKPYGNSEEAYDFLQKSFNEKIIIKNGIIKHKEVVFDDKKMTNLFANHMSKDVTKADIEKLPKTLKTEIKKKEKLKNKGIGKIITLG